MRHTDKPSDPLGQTIWNFRGKYHLSRKEAAKELGIGYVTLFSMERGYDQRTGLPFKPRESTLRQLAAKMTEFGYPVSFEELMMAAGQADDGKRKSMSKSHNPATLSEQLDSSFGEIDEEHRYVMVEFMDGDREKGLLTAWGRDYIVLDHVGETDSRMRWIPMHAIKQIM